MRSQTHDDFHHDCDGKPFEFVQLLEDRKFQVTFQIAKLQFAKLHPMSQPDSITRRGDILIVRRQYPMRSLNMMRRIWENQITSDWCKIVQQVLPSAHIIDVSVDRHCNVRVYINLREESC